MPSIDGISPSTSVHPGENILILSADIVPSYPYIPGEWKAYITIDGVEREIDVDDEEVSEGSLSVQVPYDAFSTCPLAVWNALTGKFGGAALTIIPVVQTLSPACITSKLEFVIFLLL